MEGNSDPESLILIARDEIATYPGSSSFETTLESSDVLNIAELKDND